MRLDNAYAQAVRWRYRHIFVDEAQDMNPLQYELFEAIRGQRADVFIVGDPMQAIYGWNGSDKRLFDELPDKIRGTTVLRLPNNYRCTPEILNAATTIAKIVDPQIDVRAIKPSSQPVVLRGYADAEAEAKGVVDCLWQYANTGGENPWQSAAVFPAHLPSVDRVPRQVAVAPTPCCHMLSRGLAMAVEMGGRLPS